ncbi:Fungal Zn2-Cys6 binuclear cluster domain-containing protein [Cladophialophora immunda]|nr:Fungal Zn2-Cys6 binuclear cluster domain-containing protein [Cladophialophora immunda]
MTGVAGKSKGCVTCRRRKIKCDLTSPACQNCSRFNRTCEGYGRYPVFINRTTAGVLRRKPLEEAKSFLSGAPGVNKGVHQAPLVTARAYSIGSEVSVKNVEADRYVAWFWDSFVPARPLTDSLQRPAPHWLHGVFELKYRHLGRQPALDDALLAVALTRYGKMYNAPAVLEAGQQIYTRALSHLQQSLYDEELVMLDETLATVSVMVLYELLQQTAMTPEGWSKHVTGFATLLQHRGPLRHRALLPRKLFEHSRYMLMMHGLAQRKASVFGEQEWREDPWNGADKGVEQKILDYGLRLGGLLEKADSLVKDAEGFDTMAMLVADLAEISNGIENCHSHYLPQHKSPSDASSADNHDSYRARPYQSPLNIPVKMTAFGIQLVACATGYALILNADGLNARGQGFCVINSMPFGVHTTKEWFNSKRVLLAKEICKFSAIFLSKGVGIMGASRVIVPLRLASEQLETSDPEYAECHELLQKLEGKGMEFVPALNRNEAIASRIIRRKSLLPDLKGRC